MARVIKRRLDQVLVERGLAVSRSRAQALIMAGLVYSDNRRLEKAGAQVPENMLLHLKTEDHPWVSRGGVKLASALEDFQFNVHNLVCLDIGASTGGFTDVLLSNGATKVYAVDVGHGQLAWKIRNNKRVVVLERCNARYITNQEVPVEIDFISCDVSFIGLRTLLPAPMELAGSGARLLALIKPQFEVDKDLVGKRGVVRDPEIHDQVCNRISDWLSQFHNWEVLGIKKSPIKGPEGNIEFFIAAQHS